MTWVRAVAGEILWTYWVLVRILVPVAILTQILLETGVIAAISPAFGPLMQFYGLPPELAFALLVGALVGVWNAAVVLYVLVPVADLTVADVTVFSALILFFHALPIEQQIICRAGAGFIFTTMLRIGGGLVYAALLHGLFTATGWLSDPVVPDWQPMGDATGWAGFWTGLGMTLATMLMVLAALVLALKALRALGLMAWLQRILAPALRLVGIRGEAVELTATGLLLGVSYGGGLLIRAAQSGRIPPRQILLSCVFMGFAHSVIEDTVIVVALGADAVAVLPGRIAFAFLATAVIAAILSRLPDDRLGALMARR